MSLWMGIQCFNRLWHHRRWAKQKSHLLFSNSRTAWSTKVSFSDNLFLDTHIISQESVDNFEIIHKTWSILVLGAFPLVQKCIICQIFLPFEFDNPNHISNCRKFSVLQAHSCKQITNDLVKLARIYIVIKLHWSYFYDHILMDLRQFCGYWHSHVNAPCDHTIHLFKVAEFINKHMLRLSCLNKTEEGKRQKLQKTCQGASLE